MCIFSIFVQFFKEKLYVEDICKRFILLNSDGKHTPIVSDQAVIPELLDKEQQNILKSLKLFLRNEGQFFVKSEHRVFG